MLQYYPSGQPIDFGEVPFPPHHTRTVPPSNAPTIATRAQLTPTKTYRLTLARPPDTLNP